MAFAPAQKPYRIGLLFTHMNRDFGAISATAGSCAAPRRAAPISKVESHVSNRFTLYQIAFHVVTKELPDRASVDTYER